MIRFYSPNILSTHSLPEEESRHAIRVLRRHCGDELEIVDGEGHLYRCVLTGENSKNATVEIVDCIPFPKLWQPEITLAVAPTKNMDRMEWMVEKGVEIGVDRIVPLLCDRSERRIIKSDRLRKIAISAMKQSLKATVPEIAELTGFKTFVKEYNAEGKFFGYCDESLGKTPFHLAYRPNSDVIVMIGPEGDFSPEEVKFAIENGYQPVTFGKNRLRTETAALYGLQEVHILSELADC